MIRFWRLLNDIYDKILIGIFVIVFLIVIYAAYDTWYIFYRANDDSYLRYKPGEVSADVISDSPITSDMVAWITIDDTNIDYPVMQGADNNVYLNLDPYGEYSLSGSIFLDSRCDSRFQDDYSIIYGHHMEYGVMFGSIDAFLDEDFLASHSTGRLIVGRAGDVTYDLELFYAMQTDASEEMVFDTDHIEELREFLITQGFDRDNRIVCLSTCAGGATTTRTVVFAYIL